MTIKTFRIVIDGVEHYVEVEEIREGSSAAPVPTVSRPIPTAAVAPPVRSAPKVAPPPQASASGNVVTAPLQGTILEIAVKEGDTVKAGDILVVIEAMKMENEIVAPSDGTVDSISVKKGDIVRAGDLLLSFR